jgi:hypothetical protein
VGHRHVSANEKVGSGHLHFKAFDFEDFQSLADRTQRLSICHILSHGPPLNAQRLVFRYRHNWRVAESRFFYNYFLRLHSSLVKEIYTWSCQPAGYFYEIKPFRHQVQCTNLIPKRLLCGVL